MLMSPSDSADRRASEGRAIRLPHQERFAQVASVSASPAPAAGRMEVRALRTDRPVSRPVAAECHPGDAESRRAAVHRADAHPEELREAPASRPDHNTSFHRDREVFRRIHDDRTGGEWQVFERDARLVPGSRGPSCLYFDGEGIVRRVWHYPPDWQSLPPAALLELMDRSPLHDF